MHIVLAVGIARNLNNQKFQENGSQCGAPIVSARNKVTDPGLLNVSVTKPFYKKTPTHERHCLTVAVSFTE